MLALVGVPSGIFSSAPAALSASSTTFSGPSALPPSAYETSASVVPQDYTLGPGDR
ncbi:MAG: hypothetical protein HC805_00680 [Alkalinema sp. RL_2_19]|nr:hypothetical protein [Alkalinema sp. RL_2_19]